MILQKTGFLNVLLGHKSLLIPEDPQAVDGCWGREKDFLSWYNHILLLIICYPNKTKFSCKQY